MHIHKRQLQTQNLQQQAVIPSSYPLIQTSFSFLQFQIISLSTRLSHSFNFKSSPYPPVFLIPSISNHPLIHRLSHPLSFILLPHPPLFTITPFDKIPYPPLFHIHSFSYYPQSTHRLCPLNPFHKIPHPPLFPIHFLIIFMLSYHPPLFLSYYSLFHLSH